MLKLYCIFAKESVDKMGGVRGKLAAQAGHAILHSWWDAEQRFAPAAAAYRASPKAYKITLVVPTVRDLEVLRTVYHPVCGVSLVRDAGLTVFGEPTVTCLGLGPISQEQIGPELAQLRPLT